MLRMIVVNSQKTSGEIDVTAIPLNRIIEINKAGEETTWLVYLDKENCPRSKLVRESFESLVKRLTQGIVFPETENQADSKAKSYKATPTQTTEEKWQIPPNMEFDDDIPF